ncbi:DUF4234 domain-containing protein [Stackebrandtia nassauensis]|uniref:DUF4234 domain-containing protein n=1 Tax=Stackebrandtia nassauensis (strain DSM 44728 / CIP 108903 / NRRL B-16338 / NBRC 102104 / LLR-40K-21) TaxID=446470 RepID=D3Q459_STANL|nr:DUF4234 domain-containing protein [Stackebrandtia nassauensis]ADD45944.1 hypothetical protein Snas_6326 [Stackebrandtia nassauensis DSM 44728]
MAYGQQSPQPYSEPPASAVPAIGQPDIVAAAAHATGVQLGKTRSPVAVWLLTLVTLGVYGMVWYYKVNREVRDYNGQIEVSPGLALCNVTIIAPFTLSISAIVSFVRTGGRISRAMAFARAGTCSGAVGTLLQVLLFGTGVCYYQSRLNRVWAAHGQS